MVTKRLSLYQLSLHALMEIVYMHFKTHFREFSEQYGITHLIGEYRARCLFSKTWAIRDAVIYKVQMMLQEEFQDKISNCLPALSGSMQASCPYFS